MGDSNIDGFIIAIIASALGLIACIVVGIGLVSAYSVKLKDLSTTDPNYALYQKWRNVGWGMIGIPVLLLFVVGGIGIRIAIRRR